MVEMSAPSVLMPNTRDVAILMPVRRFARARGTGEYVFCNGLRDMFKAMGRHSYVVPYKDWNTPRPNTTDFSFVRKGHSYISRPGQAAVAWLVYGVADIDVPALAHCAHGLAASPKIAQAVKAELPSMDVTVMPQSRHGAMMQPDGPATPGGIVIVANQHTKTLRTRGAMARWHMPPGSPSRSMAALGRVHRWKNRCAKPTAPNGATSPTISTKPTALRRWYAICCQSSRGPMSIATHRPSDVPRRKTAQEQKSW